eukprot:m.242904 g.242904  ORF g.242904 m.242904 type:complete len:292 (+) comp33805_c3_seq1:467-1342(+)
MSFWSFSKCFTEQVPSSPVKLIQPIIKPKVPRAPKKAGTEKVIKPSITKRTTLGSKTKKKSFKTKHAHQKLYPKVTPRGRSTSLDSRKSTTKLDVRGQSPVSSEGSMRSVSPSVDSLGMYELGLHSPFVTPTPDHHKNIAYEPIQPLEPLVHNVNPQRNHSCPLPTMGYDFSQNVLMDMDLDLNRDCTRSANTWFLGGNEALDVLLEMTDEVPTDILGLITDPTDITDTNPTGITDTTNTDTTTTTSSSSSNIDLAMDLGFGSINGHEALGQFSSQPAKFLVCPTPLKKEF